MKGKSLKNTTFQGIFSKGSTGIQQAYNKLVLLENTVKLKRLYCFTGQENDREKSSVLPASSLTRQQPGRQI
jgi:hypothetical protein